MRIVVALATMTILAASGVACTPPWDPMFDEMRDEPGGKIAYPGAVLTDEGDTGGQITDSDYVWRQYSLEGKPVDVRTVLGWYTEELDGLGYSLSPTTSKSGPGRYLYERSKKSGESKGESSIYAYFDGGRVWVTVRVVVSRSVGRRVTGREFHAELLAGQASNLEVLVS